MTTFTQRRQIGVCKTCRRLIYRIPCRLDDGPAFYDWNHEATHEHSAVYLEGQRPTIAEMMILLTALLKWHGRVLQCQVRDDEEMRLYSVREQEGERYTADRDWVSAEPKPATEERDGLVIALEAALEQLS